MAERPDVWEPQGNPPPGPAWPPAGPFASWNPMAKPWLGSLARVVRRGEVVGIVVAVGIWAHAAVTGRPVHGAGLLLVVGVPLGLVGHLLAISLMVSAKAEVRRQTRGLGYLQRQRASNRAVRELLFGSPSLGVQLVFQLGVLGMVALTATGAAVPGGDAVERSAAVGQQFASLTACVFYLAHVVALTRMIRLAEAAAPGAGPV